MNDIMQILDQIELGLNDYSEDDSVRVGRLIRTRNKLVKALHRALKHCNEFHGHADATITTVGDIARILREPAESKQEN